MSTFSNAELMGYAKRCLPLIDLTSLDDADDEAVIKKLCQQAITPYGNVAAVCIYPQFVHLAQKLLMGASVKVATVVNFPAGQDDILSVKKQITTAVANGATEIDVVLPYNELLKGNSAKVLDFLKNCRELCAEQCLKVILETGVLERAELIAMASELVIVANANFIKTSTGKVPVGATLAAAETILRVIAAHPQQAVGFKVSGGVRTVEQVAAYLQLIETILGVGWISPATVRIGASSLMQNIISYLQSE